MNLESKKYKCIIFDCDGVLVDSEPLSNQVMVDMANQLGAKIDLEYAYRHFKGNSFI
jgi:beta-phosphoglucomutase-like phosphatase (HAD superfamily)